MRKIFIFGLLVGVLNSQAAPVACSVSLGDISGSSSKWRTSITQTIGGKKIVKTDATRESDIKDYVKDMRDSVLNQNSTPGMEFFPASGVDYKFLRDGGDYGTGIFPKVEISNLGKSGEYPFALLLPVSGHTTKADALKWAKSDTYSIVVQSASSQSNLVSNAKSLDVVTVQELILKMKKGQVYKISYDRSGSAGPNGYPEGRYIEFVWDGT